MASGISGQHSGKNQILGHLGALLCIMMWGVSFVSTKVLLEHEMQPVEIYVYRFTLAYLMILCFKRTRWFSDNWRDEIALMLCGLLGGSIYFLAENFALEYTLVSNVSLLTSISPLITTLLVGALYKADRPGGGMLLGSLVAFIGVACVIFNSSFNLQINPLGDILALSAAFSWSLYSLILKRLNAVYDVWFITRKTFFYGVLTALPFMFIEHPRYTPFSAASCMPVLLNILFLGLGASLIAYVLWAATVKKVGAVKANNYMYLQPIFTMIVSVIALHEHVSAIGYTGCGLILLGLWLGDRLTALAKKKEGK
ncbi:MAG: DMT family transporter [Muribaculaceae bacterium]|nr:DMT family transporter [Muribaculaceae bacterium]